MTTTSGPSAPGPIGELAPPTTCSPPSTPESSSTPPAGASEPGEPREGRRHPHRRLRLRGTWLKASAGVLLYRLARSLPGPAVLLLAGALLALLRAIRRAPWNPLRRAAEDVSRIAGARGIAHDPRAVYHAFLDQVSALAPLVLEVIRRGPAPAVARSACPPEQRRMIEDLCRQHRGLVIATAHYTGAVYSSMWLASVLPTVLVVKNQRLPRLEAIAREVFATMGVEVAFVRDLSALELSRVAIGALRTGKALVATLDLFDRDASAVRMPLFGTEAGLGPWAYRFAIRAKVPVVPAHVGIRRGGIDIELRPPLPTGSPEEATRAFGAFLEEKVLRDPASWAMLLDKRWRAVLRAGAGAIARAAEPPSRG